MPSTYSSLTRLELMQTGEKSATWGDITNTNLGTLIEKAIAGTATVDVTAGNVTLTALNGADDQARCAILLITGSPGTARNVVAPASSKLYVVANTSNSTVTIKGAATPGVAVISGDKAVIAWTGSDFTRVGVPSDSPTFTGIVTVDGLTVGGAMIIGNAPGDSLSIAPSALTWSGNPTHSGNHTFSGNVALGAASSNTLNVGNGGIVKDANGNTGFNQATPTNFTNATTVEAKGKAGTGGGRYRVTSFDGLVTGDFYAVGGDRVRIGSSSAHVATIATGGVDALTVSTTGVVLLERNSLQVSSQANPWFQLGATSTYASFGAFYRGSGTPFAAAAGYLGTDGGGIVGSGPGTGFGIRSEGALLFMSGGGLRGSFDTDGNFAPTTTNTYALGTATLVWSTAFAKTLSDGATATGTLVSSSGTTARYGYGSSWTDAAIGPGGTDRLHVTSDGRVYGSALHNNAGAVAGTTNQHIASGTYTPTMTNFANCSAATANGTWKWTRVGNVVTFSGNFSVTITAGSTVTQIGVSLPIPSNLAGANDLNGAVSNLNAGTTLASAAFCNGDGTNDRANVQFSSGTGGAGANLIFYVIAQYEVL